MKLSFAFVASLAIIARPVYADGGPGPSPAVGPADGGTASSSELKVVPYVELGKATANLSSNVNWNPQDGNAVVDGDTTTTAAAYTTTTCDADINGIGYITVDLGTSFKMDGVRVFFGGSLPRKFCNVHLHIWDDGEKEPPAPELKALTTASPTKAPTSAPTSAPSLKPTPKPTPVPTPPLPPTRPPGVPATCYLCRGPKFICERAKGSRKCPDLEKQYCMNTIENLHEGSRYVTRSCETAESCKEKMEATLKDPRCVSYDTDKLFGNADASAGDPRFHFICNFCCAGDNCNEETVPGNRDGNRRNHPSGVNHVSTWFPPVDTTQVQGALPIGALPDMTFPSMGLSIAATVDQQFGPEANSSGTDFRFNEQRYARYIKLYVGHNSADDETSILEIQPYYNVSDIPDQQKANSGQQASSHGDPHFKTFSGIKYDFHGGCDLVLFENANFVDGLDVSVHVRTKIKSWWSYIESAVLSVGKNTLEVMGGMNGGQFWINSKEETEPKDGDFFTFSGLQVGFHRVSNKQFRFRLDIGQGDAIAIETFKSFVAVNIHAKTDRFKGSVGLLGSFPGGKMLARDGKTLVDDADIFGKEWQVLASEPMLFHSVEGPQHPQECAMPDKTVMKTKKRRLGEALITEEDAAIACGHVDEDDKDVCIFDVLATNDKEMAGSY